MKSSIRIGLSAVGATALLGTAASSASAKQLIAYVAPGHTYEAKSLRVVGDGSKTVTGRVPRGGISLKAKSSFSVNFEEWMECTTDFEMSELLLPECGARWDSWASFGDEDGAYNWGFNKKMKVPTKNGVWSKVRWTAKDNDHYVGPGDETVEFPVAKGITTYTVSNLKRVYRPATSRRVYNTDFDNYWNLCVKSDREVWASGGRLYCTVTTPKVDRMTYRLTTSTKITKRYPAYVRQ